MRTNNDALPTELLIQIFHHLDVADGPLGLRGALFVCRLWNTIILNDGHLWTSVVFNQTFVKQLAPDPAKLLNYIEKCSALSGDRFIRVSVDIAAIHDYLHPDGTPTQQPYLQCFGSTRVLLLTIARAMTRAGTFRGRVRKLVFSGGHAPAPVLQAITTSVMTALVKEHLQHLELHRCRGNAIGSIVRVPRSLETVFLFEPIGGPDSGASSGPIRARQLTFQRVSSWCGEDLKHISLYQSLTTLCLISSPTSVGDLIVAAFDDLTISEHNRHSVLLPSVTTLYITGCIPFRILDPLNLPALTTIEVRNHDFCHPLSTVHATTLHHTITRLAVLLTPEAVDGWSSALAIVLAEASQLQTLIAPRWMERHLSVPESVDIKLV